MNKKIPSLGPPKLKKGNKTSQWEHLSMHLKHMGLKQDAIGNTLGKHIGNLLGTKEK
jgi:hypothetical protein